MKMLHFILKILSLLKIEKTQTSRQYHGNSDGAGTWVREAEWRCCPFIWKESSQKRLLKAMKR